MKVKKHCYNCQHCRRFEDSKEIYCDIYDTVYKLFLSKKAKKCDCYEYSDDTIFIMF